MSPARAPRLVRSSAPVALVVALALSPLACGDAGAGDGSDAGSGGASDGVAASASSSSQGSSGAASSSSASATGSSGGASESDGEGTDGEGTGATTRATDASTTAVEPKYDVGVGGDLALDDCGGLVGGPEFSYIWIANSVEGTISKIDTETVTELGRYIVRPDSAGDPSRTSVNLAGDVVVANRNGGLTKLYARAADCVESNGQPGLQTSDGPAPLPWGEEECVAWHTPMAFSTQRPVAWTAGALNEETCAYEHAKVWTVGAEVGVPGSARAIRVNGDTGEIEEVIGFPELSIGSFGPYGGAVDGDDNFWFIIGDHEPYPLVRVEADTLAVTVWDVPSPLEPYGITVDPSGRPWIASTGHGSARFNPQDETWSVAVGPTGTGIQVDGEGRAWIAYPSAGPFGVYALDVETMEQVDSVLLPAKVKGISVDFYGYVWAVGLEDSAFRIDPVDHAVEVVDGLVQPYTYSDMTGWGLSSVQLPG
ncbi:MAG: hypothetical protein H6713_01330 [Myxococcales bacterium]|nr:hypothetical protein [Myxococcales bacterium]